MKHVLSSRVYLPLYLKSCCRGRHTEISDSHIRVNDNYSSEDIQILYLSYDKTNTPKSQHKLFFFLITEFTCASTKLEWFRLATLIKPVIK